jgi:PAS domain S-box-containing protein
MKHSESQSKDKTGLRRLAGKITRKKRAQLPEEDEALSPEESRRMLHELWVRQIELEAQNEELRRSEAELAAARARYIELFDLAPVGYCTLNQEMLILEANLTAAALLGVTRSELVRQRIDQFILKEDQDLYYRHAKQLIETGTPTAFELRMVKPAGEIFWARLEATVAKNDEGTPVCRLVISDSTELKRAEEALQNERDLLRNVINGAGNSNLAYLDRDFNFVHVNENHAANCGYRPDEMIGKSHFALFPDAETEAIFSRVRDTGEAFETRDYPVEFPNQPERGVTYWDWTLKAVKDPGGRVTGLILSTYGTTERKRVEEEVLREKDKLKALSDNANFGMVLVGEEGHFTYMNRRFSEIFGYDLSDVPDYATWRRRAYPDTKIRQAVDSALARDIRYLKPGEHGSRVFTVTCKDGTQKIAQFVVTALLSGDRLLTCEDITDRKHAEDALKDSERRFKDLVHLLPEVVFECDKEGRITLINRAVTEVFGYSPEYFDGNVSILDFIVPDDREKARENLQRALLGEDKKSRDHIRVLKKDGSVCGIAVYSSPIMRNGEPVGLRGVLSDLTERRRMEEELLRVQKLESLGILAGGIAHDFNNLMTIVLGNVELAMMRMPADHPSYPLLNTVLQSAEQTKDLTGRLITFSKGDLLVKHVSNVSRILQEAVTRATGGTPLKIVFDIGEDLLSAHVDENQIKQVFRNLTTNAIEAMPEGGTLTIRIRNADVGPSDGLPLKDGSYLRIVFADDGSGISEEHLPYVFDPYFTTKSMSDQRGTGLGLSVCYSILKKHGGHIAVTSQPGKGATFTLYLPAAAAKKKETAQPMAVSRRRVLIMEDESNVRKVEKAFLTQMGFEVTETRDGQEAIDRYKEAFLSKDPFDLVILDLVVRKGLGGQLTMEKLTKEDPSVKAIITSGYADQPVIEHYREYGFQGALKKPFRFEQFSKIVKRVIDAKT